MDIEAKFTAGIWAETDTWQVPLGALVADILAQESPDGDFPVEVAIRWASGEEITYRLASDDRSYRSVDAGEGHDASSWQSNDFHYDVC